MLAQPQLRRFTLAALLVSGLGFGARGAEEKSASFSEVVVDPARVELTGYRSRFTLLVHGKTTAGEWVDLTRDAKYAATDAKLISVDGRGVVQSIRDGATQIQVTVAGRTLPVEVVTAGVESPRTYHFIGDVEPLLTRFACNTSGCHGKAEGQNGFKLSVFGFDPQADYQALVMQGRGRRVFPADPDRSLLLGKASGRVPHGGGVRIRAESGEYEIIRNWIAAGAPLGTSDDPRVRSVSLTPRERVADAGAQQQLRVVAEYTDGRRVDVTHLAKFQSNAGLVAVNEEGLVTVGETPGQAAIMASFGGAVDTFQLLIPRSPSIENYPALAEVNAIDTLVHAKLKKLNVLPSPPAEDGEYMRRVYLDIIGKLPTADEARAFLADAQPDKRAKLVDRLLERPEYAENWALFWSDVLLVDRQTLGHKGALAYYRWILDSLAANKPLDAWTRELLTAEGPLAESPAGHFYRVVPQPGKMASTVAQVFLGVRIACAECHHHPFDRWGQDDYYAMQAFFQQVQLKKGSLGEVVLAEGTPQTTQPRTGQVLVPRMLGEPQPEPVKLVEGAAPPAAPTVDPLLDRRREFARQLTSAENRWFARNMANRIFARLMGHGLVEPVDDFRDTNPPHNPELLAALADHLAGSGFDAKSLIRFIAASAAYQRSARTNETNVLDEQNYSRALLRRLPAEVLLDAVCDTTGVPEKFDGMPEGYRAVQLWDSRVSHDFLKMFGRPIRTTACDCERVVEPSMGQVLHLMNSPRVAAKLGHDSGRVAELERTLPVDADLTDALYLTFFSRFPTEAERTAAVEYLAARREARRAAAEDLAWSLLNSFEFVFNH